jgi:hypothetical protein
MKLSVVPSEGLQLNNRNMDSSGSNDHQSDHNKTFHALPPSVAEMVKAQFSRYRDDFETAITLVSSAKAAYQQSPRVAEDAFLYAWCIVNTRSLYFRPSPSPDQGEGHRPTSLIDVVSAESNCKSKVHGNNHFMVLCPLIDLFNHASNSDSTCKVTHDISGFTVTSQKACGGREDEEIFVSYGPHSNDFLLAEYGFILPGIENIRDSISLDSVILPTLAQEQVRRLDAKGYLGEYTLFSAQANGGEAGVCWRTEVVARIEVLSGEQWEGFVDGLVDADELGIDIENKARATIIGWVNSMAQDVKTSVAVLNKMRGDQQEIMRFFGDNAEQQNEGYDLPALFRAGTRNIGDLRLVEKELCLAKRRHELALERWKQILDICHSFLGPDGLQ